ncbi:TonB-dependent receptor plug domain-containing protein [Qipengyuania sp.]|uniref:TonB-dependent receptor plug domain-containing protein n=1 Tax=Qipengyuania sp. TaxID=2004515 RepID=UPI0035C7DDD3
MFKYLFLASAPLAALPAYAQDALSGEAITVTANGLSTDVGNTGQSVTVIDRDEIENIQGADITRILTRAPGVTITRNGPIGSFTGVNVRGAGSEQLLVLIDGVRVADQASPGGGFDFGTLLATNVASIDLTRGANSTIWGADALGGVLNVSTRGSAGLSSSLEYGARDSLTATASGGVEGDRYFVGLTGSALRTDGFSAAASGTEADGLNQFGLGGSAFFDATDRIEVFANARYAEGDLEIDGFLPDFSFGDTLDTQHTRQYSGAVGATYYGMDLTLRGSYGLSDTERVNRDGVGDTTFTSDGHTDSLQLRGEYRAIGGLTLAFGGEHQWSSFETDSEDGADVSITGGYLQAGWILGGLAAHLGARVDDHELFGSEVSFGGDLSYALGGGWRIKGSVGEGFKAPALYQLFSDYGNEALQPERSTSYDLGIALGERSAARYFAVTGFRRDSEDLIGFASCFGSTAPLCASRPFGYYDNTARARAQGIEVEAGAEIVSGLRLSGLYSLIDTEDRATGNDLARRPRHSATLFADYTAGWGSFGADLRLVGESFDNATNTRLLAGYELVDLRAAIALTAGIELFGRVENVFDADYQTAAGYNSPGRGAFIGVRGRM